MKDVASRVTTNRQYWLSGFGATLMFWLNTMTANAAQLESTAKNAGGKVITTLLIITLVVAAITMVVGMLSWTTNISWLQQAGAKKFFYGAGGVIGTLLIVTFFAWLYQTMTASGGGIAWRWPF